MSAAPVPRLSVEEYFALDREGELPCEYHDGEILEIESATWAHGTITLNVGRRITERLEGKPCTAANLVRVRVSPTKFIYPDVAIVCGKPVMVDGRSDTITNPKVIVEILSPSTEGYDYRRKFSLYRLLPTFEEYVLIAQDEIRVDVFRKQPDDTWLLSTYAGPDSVARLSSLDIELPLAALYAGVEW